MIKPFKIEINKITGMQKEEYIGHNYYIFFEMIYTQLYWKYFEVKHTLNGGTNSELPIKCCALLCKEAKNKINRINGLKLAHQLFIE